VSIKIIISGVCGKMGLSILNLATKDPEIKIAGILEAKNHSMVGKQIGEFSKAGKVTDDLTKIIDKTDVLIEFTTPESTIEHINIASKAKKYVVLGTTGLRESGVHIIKQFSKQIPVVMAPNMSVGVNLLYKLVSQTAKLLSGYDIEIVELHHNKKKDAPSGTALKIAEVIAKELGRDLTSVGVYGRKGMTGPRKKEELGILSIRAGDIVGEHTVYFAGPGEVVEITHKALSRDTFANGALRAAKWIVKQKPGLYDMQDVLGLK